MVWCFYPAKALSLNSTALTKTTTGQIVNLLSNDVNKFDEVIILNWEYLSQVTSRCHITFLFITFRQVTLYLHFLWIGPLQAVTVVLLLMYRIGISCLAGMSVFFVLMPVQIMFGRLFSSLRFAPMQCSSLHLRRFSVNQVIVTCWVKTVTPTQKTETS